jgi:hypothetical protein
MPAADGRASTPEDPLLGSSAAHHHGGRAPHAAVAASSVVASQRPPRRAELMLEVPEQVGQDEQRGRDAPSRMVRVSSIATPRKMNTPAGAGGSDGCRADRRHGRRAQTHTMTGAASGSRRARAALRRRGRAPPARTAASTPRMPVTVFRQREQGVERERHQRRADADPSHEAQSGIRNPNSAKLNGCRRWPRPAELLRRGRWASTRPLGTPTAVAMPTAAPNSSTCCVHSCQSSSARRAHPTFGRASMLEAPAWPNPSTCGRQDDRRTAFVPGSSSHSPGCRMAPCGARETFALTANNITYGVAGTDGHWGFFPPRHPGTHSVWGFGTSPARAS